ncbi:MAG: hypothetical protein ACFFA8_01545 [Promethearchaeota archaeon]
MKSENNKSIAIISPSKKFPGGIKVIIEFHNIFDHDDQKIG